MKISFLLSLLAISITALPQSKRPNILLLLADDWSHPHASIYEDGPVKTTAFDWIAREGTLFTHAFVAAPSCTPSRAAILTGRYPHQVEEGANLWGSLPVKFPSYTNTLDSAGYFVGFERKGWGPGKHEAGGYTHNPAGKSFAGFEKFYSQKKEGQPFCFWFGGLDPHRPYDKGSGRKAGLDPNKVKVPAFLPDLPEVRDDLLDYFLEVKRFDDDCNRIIKFLDSAGELDNTIIIMTSDNGMPFPRGKATLYSGGTHVPLAICWKAGFKKGQVSTSFTNLVDLAPTIVEAVLDSTIASMAGKSLVPLLTGKNTKDEERVFLERERHAHVREGNLGYPSRAIRTKKMLYINNLAPDRWPAGDPQWVFSVGPYGDTDDSPSKRIVVGSNNSSSSGKLTQNYFGMQLADFTKISFAKRPPEELYDLEKDPAQLNNIIADKKYAEVLQQLRDELLQWRRSTADPRLGAGGGVFDQYPYYGPSSKAK